jgi:hypothetical protein
MDYKLVWGELVTEGNKALLNCKPNPVAFYQADLVGNQIGKADIVDEGNCGGAYIVLYDSRSEFVKWLKKYQSQEVQKNMGKGYTLSLSQMHAGYNGQSAERYEACAEAVATILKANGIMCGVRAYLT